MSGKSESVGYKRRADLTFKYNLSEGRHGWLRLTPAYSVKVVDEILRNRPTTDSVLDPFSGTATTCLCAAMRGHYAVSVDINPFLVWLGKAKLQKYESAIREDALDSAKLIYRLVTHHQVTPAKPPSISNIHKWWSESTLSSLCRLRAAIQSVAGSRPLVEQILQIAFCRTLIGVSNAAFNHQSVSFKKNGDDNRQLGLLNSKEPVADRFKDEVVFVLRGAARDPSGLGEVVLGDSRDVPKTVNGRFDLLITSPPYPNRMSYIRELRPYMFWLGYLKQPRDAGELDWEAIGGTWGIATSRLAEWQPNKTTFLPDYLPELIQRIGASNSKSGVLLANYVGKYFEDISRHLNSVREVIKPGGEVHYVVGNSRFYDVVVPVERIYLDLLMNAGFASPEIRVLRKRNSKKELFEFDVHAVAQ